MTGGEQLLADYAQTGSEAAFRELVESYVNLVYSSALRLVNGDSHLAQDVTQTVFADLARMARNLSRDVMLGGWLHRHTCFVASNTMRGERRRQLRERQAVEMNSNEDHSEANLELIAPVLDEAINQLGSEDRAAIVLRFFEQKDFQSVGAAMGSNEEAARKRVGRALEKLHSSLNRRGIVLSATALATTLTAQAVTAAPAGFALTVSSAARAGAAATGATTLTLLEIMSMTKLKIAAAAAIVVAMAIPLVLEHRENKKLHDDNQSLRRQVGQISQLSTENERLSNLLARASSTLAAASTNDPNREMLKLRGEVGQLRTAAKAPKASPISGVISDPGMRKMIRDQQKMGMGMLYRGLTNRVTLTKEQNDKFMDLLADDIMEKVDYAGSVLRDGKSREEIDELFTQQEASLLEKVQSLLGPEGLAEYQNYTVEMTSRLTSEQFKGDMTGDKKAKEEKSRQLFELMREETQAAVNAAGLPTDFQTLPILNFRNIASEEEQEKNLKFMDNIMERVTTRASAFLSPEEIKKFGEYRTKAVENSRMMLAMNRKMMSPPK
jgi:RNA polymerase sigma factor (sigma-70 family)